MSYGCNGLPVDVFNILLCLLGVVPTKYLVVHVIWGLLASHVVAIVFDVINLFCVLNDGCGHHKF